jgi:hypothetical protein
MCEQNVTEKSEPRKPVTFIKRREHRRRLGISRSKEHGLLKTDQDHPRPVPPFGYIESESDAYIQLLIARRDAADRGDK